MFCGGLARYADGLERLLFQVPIECVVSVVCRSVQIR